jgi:hypothetical protein
MATTSKQSAANREPRAHFAPTRAATLLDHVSLPAADLDRAAEFYDPVLKTPGLGAVRP